MGSQIAVVNPAGDLPLSKEIHRVLGIHPGSAVTMRIENGELLIRPAQQDDPEVIQARIAAAGGLEDELNLWRKEEEEHERRHPW